MQIGAWKSYYELEDCLTLDELLELYGAILEQEGDDFERQARLQGFDVPATKQQQQSLSERFRQYAEEKKGNSNDSVEIPGVGYKTL